MGPPRPHEAFQRGQVANGPELPVLRADTPEQRLSEPAGSEQRKPKAFQRVTRLLSLGLPPDCHTDRDPPVRLRDSSSIHDLILKVTFTCQFPEVRVNSGPGSRL